VKSDELTRLYRNRFSAEDRESKDKIWRELCEHFFQQFVAPSDTVLDVACGQGEFIRHIRCAKKIAVDLNPEVREVLPAEIRFVQSAANDLHAVESCSVDVCFISNFFEHLESKSQMDEVLSEVKRVLRGGGRFVNMQPNIRFEPGRYWDFYDHVLPLSDRSAVEALEKNGFVVERVIPRFVPFTTKSALPQHPLLVRAYLAMPWLWKILGGQFVTVARVPPVSGPFAASGTSVVLPASTSAPPAPEAGASGHG
jgi:ubiquinone/menaquinone biosynthesis C-methylase UbiE